MSSYDRPPSADRPRKKERAQETKHEEEARGSRARAPEARQAIEELEAQGKKNSSQYKKIALDHRNALSSALRK